MLRERVRHSIRGKHCGGCGIQTGFDRRGEFREGSQERALQVSRDNSPEDPWPFSGKHNVENLERLRI